MRNFRINFDEIEWESTLEGARFKTFSRAGKQIRLVEFTRDFVEPEWCVKGHTGYVIEGRLEIDFKGEKKIFSTGDGIFIPEGADNAHKARSLTSTVKFFLVEDITI